VAYAPASCACKTFRAPSCAMLTPLLVMAAAISRSVWPRRRMAMICRTHLVSRSCGTSLPSEPGSSLTIRVLGVGAIEVNEAHIDSAKGRKPCA
jgi:hypothetical protein